MYQSTIRTAAGTFLAVVLLFTLSVKTQTRPRGQTKSVASVSEIKPGEWGLLAGALSREDWENAARLSSDYIKRLRGENEKKQLAQLRYLNLFSLAGKLSAFIVGGNERATGPARVALREAVEQMTGSELLAPPRSFSQSCGGRLNFICPVKDNPKALRISATNKDGDSILSFEYFLFDDAVRPFELEGRKVFVGGVLDRAEFNEEPSKPWIMRLFLKKSFARISVGE